jgi:hypothetical protein
MGWALLPVPPLVPDPGVRLVAPADIAFVIRDVGQHRLVPIGVPGGLAAIARLAHGFSLPTLHGAWMGSGTPRIEEAQHV